MTADTIVDFGFCSATNVADELPQFGPFTDSSRPKLSLVETWIAEAAAEMRIAIASGGYEIDEPLKDGSNISRWFCAANVLGAKMRLGRFLYSYGPTEDVEIPWQADFLEKVSMLRRGTIIFPEDDIAEKNRL